MQPNVNFIALILLIVCFSYVFTRESKNEICRQNEEWNDCGILWWCEATCEQPRGQACPRICSPGCFCKADLIRRKAKGTCIHSEYCDHSSY